MQIQNPELNIQDGLVLIDHTVTSLERIRSTESELNDQIDASVKFAETLGSNPADEFAKKSARRISRRLDDNPKTSAVISLLASSQKCMIEVLDSLSTEYRVQRYNIRDCLEKTKPLAVILQPPMTQPMIEQVEHVAGLFSSSVSADSLSLAAELANFVTETEETYISQRLQMLQTSVH